MTTADFKGIDLTALDLAAMLCSRVCHDVISPVGAVVNGLEILEDESSADMKDVALDLIRRSAASASAKLQFCRLAFGAAGSAGATIDTGDAETVARSLLDTEKTNLVWKVPRQFLAKSKAKLLLNLCQMAGSAIPRGGLIEVEGADEGATLSVTAKGTHARLQAGFADVLTSGGAASVDAHNIQPYFAYLVAKDCGMTIDVFQDTDILRLQASTQT